jgi:predicted dehydrogenase
LVALCDVREKVLNKGFEIVKEKTGKEPKRYFDYLDIIKDGGVDAVIVATAWDSHVKISVDFMQAGIAVGCEVFGAYDIEDCWQLVRTYEQTRTPFMMLENCCYDRFELLATAMARAGKFGEIVYCHGSYAHDLKESLVRGRCFEHFRTEEYVARNGDTYPTHNLGPIAKLLGINRGNRLLTLTSMSTKTGVGLNVARQNYDTNGTLDGVNFNMGDIVVTTIKCANGEVITLRLDTTLPRFYDREFTVRGTKGLASQTQNMILLEEDHNLEECWESEKSVEKFLNCAKEYDDYLVDFWKGITDEQRALGHGGMDYFLLKAFFDAVKNGEEMPIDVYDAATWMAITPLSEQSVAMGGAPQPIPDFTRGAYIRRPLKDVVQLPNPSKNK